MFEEISFLKSTAQINSVQSKFSFTNPDVVSGVHLRVPGSPKSGSEDSLQRRPIGYWWADELGWEVLWNGGGLPPASL